MNARDLLEAGAVLPLDAAGTEDGQGGGGGDAKGDVLVARGYRHPALDERVVVRLVPEALGEAEDLALEFLGFGAEGGERVGRVRRQSLGFPAWALVNDPANGRHALAVVKEMERLARMTATKPGHAKDGFDEIAVRLDRSVPHFLPTYYEQVARLFLGAESTAYASSFFGKAREAERRHALAIDEERLREVFLEFAAAGALSGKTLREQAKGLAERLSPQAAFEQFRILCRERGAAGLAPYAGMLEDLRRLTRAAGQDVTAEETELVAELLRSGAVARAPLSFWKTAGPSLVSVARRYPEIRVRLLRLLPLPGGEKAAEFDDLWLTTLEAAGAFALLAGEETAAAGVQAADGTGTKNGTENGTGAEGVAEAELPPTPAEWFSAWAAHRKRGYWRHSERLPRESALVERFAAQLAREKQPVDLARGRGRRSVDLDLLDVCLAAGVPVADPDPGVSLDLEAWLGDEAPGRRDLAATAADPRFTLLLRKAVESLASSSQGAANLRRAAADPVLGPVVTAWLEDRAADLARPLGLPELDRQLTRISRFAIPAALGKAPAAVARISAVGVAPVLARTLRAGVLDELGWAALDDAAERLRPAPVPAGTRPAQSDERLQLEDAWPVLITARGSRVLAVGPDGVLDDRTLTLPAPQTYSWARTVLRWVDGQWLIASGHGDERRAAWSGRPADPFTPQGTLEAPWQGSGSVSLPLPGGGRFYGTRPLRAGDTSFGDRRPVAADGVSYWVLHERRWYEYDPATARRGRPSVPAFLDSALGEGVEGAVLVEAASRLLPLQPGLEGSPLGSAHGLLGWWVRYDPADRTLTACSVDGTRSPARAFPEGMDVRNARGAMPAPPLRLPGAVLHPVVSSGHTDSVVLLDTEGVEMGTVDTATAGNRYAGGTPLVAPFAYWHALRPRDPAGSAVLRAVTDAQAAALVAAAAAGTDPAAAVRATLPGLTHPALVAGVAALVAESARALGRIGDFTAKATAVPAPVEPHAAPVAHARDGVLTAGLRGLSGGGRASYYRRDSDATPGAMEQLRALRRMIAGDLPPAKGAAPATYTLHGTSVAWTSLFGTPLAAVAARAASPGTAGEERKALAEFLTAALGGGGDGAEFAEPRGRLRNVELCEPRDAAKDRLGQVHRAGERAMLVLGTVRVHDDRQHWQAVEFAPEGRFGPWEGFTLVAEDIVGGPDDPARTASLRRIATLTAERGPVPYDPAAAGRFAALTGVDVSIGALLLLGLPAIEGYGRESVPRPETLALAGLRPTRAATARDALRRLSVSARARLLAALVPADPAAVDRLWEVGFDGEALAAQWLALHGRQRTVPIELIERAERETYAKGHLSAVLNHEHRPELTGRTELRLAEDELVADDPRALLTGSDLGQYVSALRWLAYRLPYGDPLRAVLPGALAALRARLADEGLLLNLGVDWTSEGASSSRRIREAYGLPATGGADARGFTPAGPAIVLLPARYGGEGHESVYVRSAPLLPGASPDGGPDHPALVLLAGLSPHNQGVQALREAVGEDLAALVAADGPAGAPQYPGHSVPELVTEAAGALGLSQDAAALYLMLLALPDPTDRQVAAWSGWKPARLKKARAELAATDLVVEAKRARAGRTLFLPGGWLDRKAPRLPMETWKQALFAPEREHGEAYLVPREPVPDLFRRAWRRVGAGDAPGFEEFAARRGGRGGRR